jgi:hypothetical protein
MRLMRARCFFAILDKARPDVRIEHRDPRCAFPPHQRFIGRAAGLRDQADGAKEQRFGIVGQCRQIGFREHAPSRAFVVEDVACVPVDQPHEGERRRSRRYGCVARSHLALREHGSQLIAEQV